MGEQAGYQRERLTDEECRAEELEPKIKALAGFLTAAHLPNGTTARMDPGVAGMLAEAVIRWQDGDM